MVFFFFFVSANSLEVKLCVHWKNFVQKEDQDLPKYQATPITKGAENSPHLSLHIVNRPNFDFDNQEEIYPLRHRRDP